MEVSINGPIAGWFMMEKTDEVDENWGSPKSKETPTL